MRIKKGRKVSGWILFNKPYEMTSTRAVSKIKYLFEAKKAGHAGTLDPLATGMLPIALGEATKTVPYVIESKKAYEFTICWGEERTTDDLEGDIQNISHNLPSKQDVLNIMPKYLGVIKQTPPKFSAIKINGNRAYEFARQNIDIELKHREINIYKLDLKEHSANNIYSCFEVECSKGTYIRSLARDMGRDLNCYGYISKLNRSFIESFKATTVISLQQLTDLSPKENNKQTSFDAIDNLLLPLDNVLKNFDNYEINSDQFVKIQNGNHIVLFNITEASNIKTACVNYMGKIVALGLLEKHLFKPTRVFQL